MYTVEVYGLVMGIVFIAVFLFALAVAVFRMIKDYARTTRAMRRITPLVFAETRGSEPQRVEFTRTEATTERIGAKAV